MARRPADLPDEDEPKDRVLHTRIPESLEDAIKSKARRLRIPVSNLVRNVPEQTFQLVEDVVGDGLAIPSTARRCEAGVRQEATGVGSQAASSLRRPELIITRG